MRKHLSTIALVMVLVAGLSLLLYPTFSDWWNRFHQSRLIESYNQTMIQLDDDTYEKMLAEAQEYNRNMTACSVGLALPDDQRKKYNSVLNVNDTGVMGYVEIPAIQVMLPIYHGTDEGVLQLAIGHLEGTSLPVGGESTHCVISGHRGLPSARLFTDIDNLVVGDEFMLHTLDEVLTYEVDQIQIVLPYELSSLQIVPGEDLCTLVTCTPYGVNSHRLLVRGHRIDTENTTEVRVVADVLQIRPALVAPFVAAPMLLVLLILLFTAPSTGDDDDDFDDFNDDFDSV